MEAFRMSPENKKIPGFRYFGEGLDKGVCGVTIDSIKANFNGLAKCNLGTLEDEEFSGFIEIIVAREYTIFRNQFFFGCRKTKHFQGFLTISIVGVFAQFSGVTIVVVAWDIKKKAAHKHRNRVPFIFMFWLPIITMYEIRYSQRPYVGEYVARWFKRQHANDKLNFHSKTKKRTSSNQQIVNRAHSSSPIDVNAKSKIHRNPKLYANYTPQVFRISVINSTTILLPNDSWHAGCCFLIHLHLFRVDCLLMLCCRCCGCCLCLVIICSLLFSMRNFGKSEQWKKKSTRQRTWSHLNYDNG